MQVNNPLHFGLRQAMRYYKFLFFANDDVRQAIHLASLQVPNRDAKLLARAIDRELYHLARELGFRKRHMSEGRNERQQWWERRDFGMNEVIFESLRRKNETICPKSDSTTY